MLRTPILPLLIAALIPSAPLAAAELNDQSLSAAFDAVAEDGVVIVYTHGSDWNPAGKLVAKSIWQHPAFRSGLPSKAQLTNADILETPRHKRIERLLIAKRKNQNQNAVLSVEGGASYTGSSRGSWTLDQLETTPQASTYTFSFTTENEITSDDAFVLSLTPPVSAVVAASFKGLTTNGRITISELTIADHNGGKLPIRTVVTSEEANPNQPTTRLTDGDESAAGTWTAESNGFRCVNLLIFPAKPIATGTKITLSWTVKSAGQSQLPVEVKLGQITVNDSDAFTTMAANEEFRTRLPLDARNLPAIFTFDKNRRLIGRVSPVLVQEDPATVAKKIHDGIKNVFAAEAILASAAKETDTQKKIDLLVQGATALGPFLDGNRRKQIVADLAKLDPENISPARWAFDFNTTEFNTKIAEIQKNEGLDAAFAFIDQTISSPRASKLTNEQKQRFVLEKFKRAKAEKKTWPELVPHLRELAKLDPTTHLGHGANGQIDSNGLGEPTMAFGFWPTHLKGGNNTLTITRGLAVFAPVSGDYELKIVSRRGSKGTLIFNSASIVDSTGKVLSSHKVNQKMDAASPIVKIPLNVPKGTDPAKISIKLDITADATPEASGTFSFKPTLPAEGKFGFK